MEETARIISLLENLSDRLDSVEADFNLLVEINTDLQIQSAQMTEDLSQIKSDISELEPGII